MVPSERVYTWWKKGEDEVSNNPIKRMLLAEGKYSNKQLTSINTIYNVK